MVERIFSADVAFHDILWLPQRTPNSDKSILVVYGDISCGGFKLIDNYVEGYLEIPN